MAQQQPVQQSAQRLKDKVVLVTGAGGAIGREIAFECVHQGAIVEFADLNQEEGDKTQQLIAELGGPKSAFTKVNVCAESEVSFSLFFVHEQGAKLDQRCGHKTRKN